MEDFLPDGYVMPDSGSGYLKLQKGENRFRFLTSPITGLVWFEEESDGKKSVHRIRPGEKAPLGAKAKHFWAAIVYDLKSESVKILEITQKSIQSGILNLNSNQAWGNPKDYNLCVVKEGDGMETSYQVLPEPESGVDQAILDQALKINLNAL